MNREPRQPERSGSDEAVDNVDEDRTVPDSAMSNFKRLTKRLLLVPSGELKEKERKYLQGKPRKDD
jgi:hypothetical protein